MKGFALTEYILTIGLLIVEVILLSMFTVNFLIPGINAAEVIESVSLGNSIATTANALSVQDEGEIKLTFSRDFLITAGIENKKNYILVTGSGEDKNENKVFLEAKLKNLIQKNTKTLTLRKTGGSDLVEVLA